MNPEGQLTITLKRGAHQGCWADIRSSRPLSLPRIFHGKSVDHLLATLPMLYRVCGAAQGVAAVSACEQALKIEPDAEVSRRRAKLVWLETAKEHLWRILTDWGPLIDYRPEPELVGQIRQLQERGRRILFGIEDPFRIHAAADRLPLLSEPLPQRPSARGRGIGMMAEGEGRATLPGSCAAYPQAEEWRALIRDIELLLGRLLFGETPRSWLARDNPIQFRQWLEQGRELASGALRWVEERGWERLGDAPVALLEEGASLALEPLLHGEGAARFIAAPVWQETPRETGVLARNDTHPMVSMAIRTWGNGLMTRMIARLTELARLPGLLEEEGGPPSTRAARGSLPGTGIASVQAARGLLVHRAVIDGERVEGYAILAPTEWNFHPQGVVAGALATLNGEDEAVLRQQASLLIGAIDPCVGYALVIRG